MLLIKWLQQLTQLRKVRFFQSILPDVHIVSKNGFPIIQFQIANQDKLLNASTLRLNGTLRLQAPGSNASTLIHPTNSAGGAAASNGIALNERIGVASVLQQITLATQSNQTLEVVRSYGRYLASVMPITHSASDFDTANSIGNPASASRSFVSAHNVNNDVSFSIPLRTGLLNSGSPLPLGNNGLRGLLINLELAQMLMSFLVIRLLLLMAQRLSSYLILFLQALSMS